MCDVAPPACALALCTALRGGGSVSFGFGWGADVRLTGCSFPLPANPLNPKPTLVEAAVGAARIRALTRCLAFPSHRPYDPARARFSPVVDFYPPALRILSLVIESERRKRGLPRERAQICFPEPCQS